MSELAPPTTASSAEAVPSLPLSKSATANKANNVNNGSSQHTNGGATPSSMRMFTPRQQPSAAHHNEPRGARSARAGTTHAAHCTGTPVAGEAASAPTTAATGSPVANSIPAKKVRPSTGATSAGAKGPDLIPSTVPSPSTTTSTSLTTAAHAPRPSTGVTAVAADERPSARGLARQRTPRVTQKLPPAGAAPAFSTPPHKRHLRSTPPVGATVTSRPSGHTTTSPHTTTAHSVAASGSKPRSSTHSMSTTPVVDDAATLSSSTQSRDYVRPPARATPLARPTARASISDVSSNVRGVSEESERQTATTPLPPPSQTAPPAHADPTARLTSAPVVRASPAAGVSAAAAAGSPDISSGPHALRVHPPQQSTTVVSSQSHSQSHSQSPSSGPASTATHPAHPAASAGSAPRPSASTAAAAAPTTPASSRRTIQSRALTGVTAGRSGSSAATVRPVGSARAGNAQAGMHMADLVRPSDAYKVKLAPTAQQRTVARRSRQPRKIVNTCLTKYPVIRRVAETLGFEIEESEDELNAYQFNLCWSDTVLPLVRLVRLGNWQRTNHFPSMYLLCRKLHLATTLGRMQRKLPHDFHFFPMTWSMRSERAPFVRYLTALKQKKLVKFFIVKPNAGCQGRGIQVTRDPLNCVEDPDNYIAQEYIPRPLLIEDRKFDLRVYVLLTSIREPSIFMYNDGLVRMCAETYEAPTDANVKNTCKHLTNYAVNKRSPEFVYNTDASRGDVGNKRNFRFFNRWLAEQGEAPQHFWEQVGFVIVKTILAAQPHIAMVYNSCFPRFNEGHTCFEILGFDILVDHKMKPWLMEVNHTPSFATDTPLDDEIKTGVLTEAWDIVDCKATDYERDRQRERHDFAMRNMRSSSGQLSSARLRRPAGMANAYNEGPASPENDEQAELQARQADEQLLAARLHEDSKLKNYVRLFPTETPEYDDVYRTVRTHAEADAVMRATNGSMFVSGVTGPVLSAHAVGTASSPVSVASPLAADTYRFPTNRSGSPHPHVRTTSASASSTAETSVSPGRTTLLSTPAAPVSVAPVKPAAAPPVPEGAAPAPAPVSAQAESYKKLEEEMLRVRRRASQDAAHPAVRRADPPTSSPPPSMAASADTEVAAACTTPAVAETASAPSLSPSSSAVVEKHCSHKPVPVAARTTAAGESSAGRRQLAVVQKDRPTSVTPLRVDQGKRTQTAVAVAAPHNPPHTLQAPQAPPESVASTSSAVEPHALSSVAPLADSAKGKGGPSSSHHSSARNTPSRGLKRSGPSTPQHGPSTSPRGKTSKEVSPEDLRRLASLQEQLERAEEAEPEIHESDESFDLDE